jgi:hypothetical protein
MGVLSCIKLIYNNFDLKETNSSRVEVTSIPVCRDAPCNETNLQFSNHNFLSSKPIKLWLKFSFL